MSNPSPFPDFAPGTEPQQEAAEQAAGGPGLSDLADGAEAVGTVAELGGAALESAGEAISGVGEIAGGCLEGLGGCSSVLLAAVLLGWGAYCWAY